MLFSIIYVQFIVVLALQPILKLPPQWNAKYPDLSSPILQVVPSILPFDQTGHMTVRSHDHSTTIAAIFDNGKKNFFLSKLGMFSKISLSRLHHQLYAVTGM